MKALILAGTLAAIATAASAQQATTPSPASPPAATTAPAPTTTTTTTATPSTPQMQQPTMTTAEAEKLIGKEVVGAEDKKIGEIDNVLGTTDGKARAFVIEHGGFLGFGEKKTIVEASDLTISGDKIKTSMSEEQLKQAPAYDKNNLDPRYQNTKPAK